MSVRVYNTMSKKKEELVPLQQGRIGMYACGVTVYDLCHIGHARSAVVFDGLENGIFARHALDLEVCYLLTQMVFELSSDFYRLFFLSIGVENNLVKIFF